MELNDLKTLHNWNLPTVCPVCGEPLILSVNHKQLTCSNEFCSSRSSGNIAKWVEKMKILELGLTTIEKIQSEGFFMTISQIYSDIEKPEVNTRLSVVLGPNNWQNIKTEIKKHTETTLACFIAGYNISGVGEKQVQKVLDAKGFKTLSELFYANNFTEFLCDGIGSVIAEKLFTGLRKYQSDMIETAKTITITVPEQKTGTLSGKSFCFTGAMDYPRKVLQSYVEEQGGINLDSVKKSLDFLVIQDPNSTSGKAKKAREQGIRLISPDEFLTMVGKKC